MPNKHYYESTISGTAPAYDRRQHFGIGGVSMIIGAVSTISQSVNQGALDVPEPKFCAARPETDGMPYLSANNHCRNELLQYGCRDGGQNMSEVSEFEFAPNAHKITTKAELAQYQHQ